MQCRVGHLRVGKRWLLWERNSRMSEYDGMDRMAGDGFCGLPPPVRHPGAVVTPGPHAYVAQSPRVLARMPDMGPETTAIASEEPVPTAHEGRLIGARLSANVLVGGVPAAMLVALAPYLVYERHRLRAYGIAGPQRRGSGPLERFQQPGLQLAGPAQPRTARTPLITAPPGTDPRDRTTACRRASPPSRTRPLVNPPGAQPTPPASVPAADGSSPWNGQTPRTPAADATGSWRGGNPSGVLAEPVRCG